MFSWIVNAFADFLALTDLKRLDSLLSAVASLVAIIAAAVAGAKCICRGLRRLTQQKPVDRLYKALIAHSVVSKSEVVYQILSYLPPRFEDRKTIRKLLRQIKACSGEKQEAAAVFSVIGAPACGKTTTMRYLYCKLSKGRKCVYFQMQDVTSMEKLGSYLEKQKAENHFGNGDSVVAFFDGLDEAHVFFQKENPDSMEKAFRSMFFFGGEPDMNKLFQAHGLNLECTVVSLRPEFLERSTRSLTELQHKNIYSNVYKILPLSDRDVIKIFKSLRSLKSIEARKKEMEPRHQDRYPSWWKTPYYTWLLRHILKQNPNSLFHYPMYIRYAYAFMKEYQKLENSEGPRESRNNIAVSFDVLLDAIIKWEFHIYFENKSAKKNPKEMERFKRQIENCAEALVLKLLENKKRYLPKEQFQAIVRRYFSGEASRLAIAHCFMSSDDEGTCFFFCHHTFYEYFLAKHLFEKADYHRRKELLYSSGSDYLRAMYYSILCRAEKLNDRITNSAKYIVSKGNLTLSTCLFLEKEGWMDLHDEPSISLVEILEYLPCIHRFQYRDQDFTQEALEELIDSGKLDLSGTGWDRLLYAVGVTPLERIKTLHISGLPLRDPEVLRRCRNMKWLEMLYANESDPVLENILDVLSGLSLGWIHIQSADGSFCRTVQERLRSERLSVDRVYVKTPNYSQAHLELYRLNQSWKELNQPARFYLSVRSELEEAKDIFHRADSKKDVEMLTAVFELEANEDGILGLSGKSPEATYWNGMSLVAYYKYKDSIDEDQSANRVCLRLAPYIEKNDSELSVRFGEWYGKILILHSKSALADSWLTNTFCHGKEYLSEKRLIECGIYLYKARIRAENREKLGSLAEDLENRIKKQPEYQKSWYYRFFLKIFCADLLETWKKGTPAPKALKEALELYRDAAQLEEGENSFHRFQMAYYEMVYANRSENLELGRKTLEKLTHAWEIANEKPDPDVRLQQAEWIQYHEQALYLALLEEDRKCVLDLDEKLLSYPYRRGDLSLEKLGSIRQAYQESEHPDIDKHLLWSSIWY